MDKFKFIANIESQVYFPNIEDWKNNFWKNNYLVRLTSQGIPFAVNADSEQDAMDYIIDYCEDYLPGLLMDEEEEKVTRETAPEYLEEDFYCGGNHSRYLNTREIYIEQI